MYLHISVETRRGCQILLYWEHVQQSLISDNVPGKNSGVALAPGGEPAQCACIECQCPASPRPEISKCLRDLRKTLHSFKKLHHKSSIEYREEALVVKVLAMQTLRPEFHPQKQCVQRLIQLHTIAIAMRGRWTQVDPQGLIDQSSLISKGNEILPKVVFAVTFNYQLCIIQIHLGREY